MNENDLDCLDWLSQSPSINIILNMWLILKLCLGKSPTAIKTRVDLNFENVVLSNYSQCQKLISHNSEKIKSCN